MMMQHEYTKASGQHLSLNKCKFYTGNASPRKVAQLANLLSFGVGSLPFNYLGVPIFKGKPRKPHLQHIADKIFSKLSSWKGFLLSTMDRVELVKSVIESLLLHSFKVYAFLVSLVKHLDCCIRDFIWGGSISVKRVVTVAWKKVCIPYKEGGLGIKSLRVLNEAAMLILA